MGSWILAGALIATWGTGSVPQVPPVEIAFSGGTVTLSAADVPVADVLAAWGQAGHADVTGAEYLGARRISIHLTAASEAGALQAIVGSPGWYSTALRQSPAASESMFERIAILPGALAAANPAAAPEPEKLYSYASVPVAAGGAVAGLVTAPPAADARKRPANLEPESFYQYDSVPALATDLPGNGAAAAPASGQPLPQAALPEEIYSYTATPEPREPVVASAIIPPTPALVPEAVFTYDPTPQGGLPATIPGLVIPDIPTVEGWMGPRLPGRLIRYVIDK